MAKCERVFKKQNKQKTYFVSCNGPNCVYHYPGDWNAKNGTEKNTLLSLTMQLVGHIKYSIAR